MNRRLFLIAQSLLVLLAGYWWYTLVWQNLRDTASDLRVHFLDVGQGDAVLIETPNDRRILVDAGRGMAVLDELQTVLTVHDRHLDGVILTHPDADHVGGFVPVFKQYEVGTVIRSFIESGTHIYGQVKEEIRRQREENGTAEYAVNGPRAFSLDGVRFRILWPVGEEVRETNAASIILLAEYGDMKILLTGDANSAVEDAVAERFAAGTADVDILKAGHHGSKTSTSARFLNHTRPNAIIYSASKNNRYGHPHPAVLGRVQTYRTAHPEENLREYRTAEDGTVSFCLTRISFAECP